MGLITSFPGGNGSSEITVDSALNTTSENPVQNKVITTELNKKANSSSIPTQLSQLTADSTHRTVTDTEKSTWNGKQNAITAGDYLAFDGNTLNAQLPVVANQFDKANIYSTTEKVVGCWTDGRPLYQKTIDCGNLPNATSKNIAHSISNLNIVTGIKGFVYDSSANQSSPIDAIAEGNWSIAISANRTNVIVQTWANYSTLTNFKIYVTLQYTKTTDAANSFNYADENDYSTTEHIVGSWIDGKPVYQKVIQSTLPIMTNANTSYTKMYSIGASVDTYVKTFGMVRNALGSNQTVPTVNPESNEYMRLISYNNNASNDNKNKVKIQVRWSSWSEYPIDLFVQYTKTTD